MLKTKRIFLIILSIVLISCSSVNQNTTMPDFEIKTLTNKTITNKDLTNKIVIINFWATSCTTCIAEMPKLAEIYEKYHSKGLELIAVAMPYDAPMYVKNFAQTRKLPFDVALDLDGKITKSFGDITLTPTTFVFAKNKRIQKVIGEPNWVEFEEMIKKSLNL